MFSILWYDQFDNKNALPQYNNICKINLLQASQLVPSFASLILNLRFTSDFYLCICVIIQFLSICVCVTKMEQ